VPLSVLLVSHGSNLHGAERSLGEAARSLRAHSVDVHVALPRTGPLEATLASAELPVTVARHPWPWWVGPDRIGGVARARAGIGALRRSGAPLAELREIVKAVRPDVVVTNTITFPHGAVAARREGVPHVWHVREFGREDLGLGYLYGEAASVRLMGALSARVLTCSQAVAAKLERFVERAKLHVVYNAVVSNEEPVRARRDNPPVRLLTLGRLHPRKGQEDAVRATALLAERGVDVELSLVGGGADDYRAWLDRLARSSAARGRVTFHEFTEEPERHLSRCDVFLMTSRSEAFGRVTVEAMRAGRPVVGAGAAGTLELVRDGWNGLLYRVGDPEDLARQLRRLLEDQALSVRLAAVGQEWARRTFSLERHGAELFDVLSYAARGSAPVRPKHAAEIGSHA
jgi:glycosyltransferase involved in cell wall biosynthesis